MKLPKCKNCGQIGHYKTFCFKTKQKVPKRFSEKYATSNSAMRKRWFELNPPNHNGKWICYLQISKDCPELLTSESLTLEHIMPKVKAPELKFNHENIAPSCQFCNTIKASRTLESLATEYPRLASMI